MVKRAVKCAKATKDTVYIVIHSQSFAWYIKKLIALINNNKQIKNIRIISWDTERNLPIQGMNPNNIFFDHYVGVDYQT